MSICRSVPSTWSLLFAWNTKLKKTQNAICESSDLPEQAVKLLSFPDNLVNHVALPFQAEPPHHPCGVQHTKEPSSYPSSLWPERFKKAVTHQSQKQPVAPLLPHPARILPRTLGGRFCHLTAVYVGEVKDRDILTAFPLRQGSGRERCGEMVG